MLSNSLKSNEPVPAIDREQSAHLSAAIFSEQYQRPGIPVVIRGLLEAEPDWSLDYLCQALRTLEFPVRHYGRSRSSQNKQHWTTIGSGVESQTMPFLEYARLLENGEAQAEDLYLGKCSIEQTALVQRSTLPQVGLRLGLTQAVSSHNLWVGVAGHTTHLHYDPFDGTLVQLHGTKRLILFPPSQLANLYPFPLSTHLKHGLKLRSTYSQVDLDRPDFNAFPKFEEALQSRSEVILNPGDVLYIPACWWHEVTAVGDEMVCSVNRFWRIQPAARGLRSWSKWRAHLGSVMATPHIVKDLVAALLTDNREQKLKQLRQRL
ncbi:MAG: cupin-like domain-containing protein [Leptolyngbyaceae cyanobacterium SM1_3_5]|nr:cupin-like domain-containing protein [Leptolyngbyaceae cyanobacterium SM1_3_5]